MAAVEAAASAAPCPVPGAGRVILPLPVVDPLARAAAAAERLLGRSLVGAVAPGRAWLNARLHAALEAWTKRGNMTARMRSELDRVGVDLRVGARSLASAAAVATEAASEDGAAVHPALTWSGALDSATRVYVAAVGAVHGWKAGEAEAGASPRAAALHARLAAWLAAGGGSVEGLDPVANGEGPVLPGAGPVVFEGLDGPAVAAAVGRAGAAAPPPGSARAAGRGASGRGGASSPASSRGASPSPAAGGGGGGGGGPDAIGAAAAAAVGAALAAGGFPAASPEAWAISTHAAEPATITATASRFTSGRSGKIKPVLNRALLAAGPAGATAAEAVAIVNAAGLAPPGETPWPTDKARRQAASHALAAEPESFVVVASRGHAYAYAHVAFPAVAAHKAELARAAAARRAGGAGSEDGGMGGAAPPPPPPPPPPPAPTAVDMAAIQAIVANPALLADPAALAAAVAALDPATRDAVAALLRGGGGG